MVRMVEPEVAFLDLEGDANLAEDFLVSVVSRVLERRAEELKVLERDTTVLQRVQKPFPRIRYAEAIRKWREDSDKARASGARPSPSPGVPDALRDYRTAHPATAARDDPLCVQASRDLFIRVTRRPQFLDSRVDPL